MINSYKSILDSIGGNNKRNRDLWLERTLKKIPKGSKILDAGAGELQYKKFCNHLEYVSQDFGQYDGKGDKKGLQTERWDNTKLDIVSDITNIPVPDSSFDAIMCIEVFEHIPEPIKAIKEFSRILKRGGMLILTAPVCSYTHFAPFYFYNGFSTYFYRKFLKDNCFEILEISFNGNYFGYIAHTLYMVPTFIGKYSKNGGRIFKVLFSIMILPILIMLFYFSKKDKGSEEILSYGINVKAIKVE